MSGHLFSNDGGHGYTASIRSGGVSSKMSEISADVSTNSIVFTPLLTHSVTLQRAGVIIATGGATLFSSGFGTVSSLIITIGGVQACQEWSGFHSNSIDRVHALIGRASVAAGTHIVNLEWKTSNVVLAVQVRAATNNFENASVSSIIIEGDA